MTWSNSLSGERRLFWCNLVWIRGPRCELARQGRRDYLDVRRSGFLVWGVWSQPVSVVNLIKVAEGGAPAVNRCPSQWSHLQPSDSSYPVGLVLPALCCPST